MPGEDDLRSAILAGEGQGDSFVAKAFVAAAKNSGEKSDNPAGGSKPKVVKRAKPARIGKKGPVSDFTTQVAEAIKRGTVEIVSDRKDYTDVVYALDSLVSRGVLEKENGIYSAKREKGQKIIDALKDREDTRYLVDGGIQQQTNHEEKPVTTGRAKRPTKAEQIARLQQENEAAEKDMQALFKSPNFHKQTREEFESDLQTLRLGDKLKATEVKRAEILERFNKRVDEIEEELKVLREKTYVATDAEAKEISQKMADLITEEVKLKHNETEEKQKIEAELQSADREIRAAEIDIKLRDFLDSIKANGKQEVNLPFIASTINKPNVNLSEMLAITDGALPEDILITLTAAIKPEFGEPMIGIVDNQLRALTPEGENLIRSLTNEIRTQINKEVLLGGAIVETEELLGKAFHPETSLTELLKNTGDVHVLEAVNKEIINHRFDLIPSGEIVPLTPEAAKLYSELLIEMQEELRERYIAERAAELEVAFERKDPLRKTVLDKIDSLEAKASDHVWINPGARLLHYICCADEDTEALVEREDKAKKAETRYFEVSKAEENYERMRRNYLVPEAELRANVLIELARNPHNPNLEVIREAAAVAGELEYSQNPGNRQARRLVEVGEIKMEEAKKTFPTRREMIEELPEGTRERIKKEATELLVSLVQEILGVKFDEKEKAELAVTGDAHKYIDTYIVEEAAIRKVRKLVTGKNIIDAAELKVLLEEDIVKEKEGRQRLFKEIVKSMAKKHFVKNYQAVTADVAKNLGINFDFNDPNPEAAIDKIADREAKGIIEEAALYGKNALSAFDKEPEARDEESEEDIPVSYGPPIAREISITRSLVANQTELGNVRAKKKKDQGLWSLVKAVFLGES